MRKLKAQVLRLYGDHGAETLDRYFAQIEYTAYWCIRMLLDNERIVAVIPEGVEDVVIERMDCFELHQVKTRDESRGPWTTAEVWPVLCAQYHRRKAFSKECSFYFISDGRADIKVPARSSAFGPLFRLKWLLSILHDGQTLTDGEDKEMRHFKNGLIPVICERLQTDYGEPLDNTSVSALLHRTRIETDHHSLRNPSNLAELEQALVEALPGLEPCTLPQLRDIYDNLILLIVHKIREGLSLEERRIERDDVLQCRTTPSVLPAGYPDLDHLPGISVLDKKALLGGFDATELPAFHRQKQNAEYTLRKLRAIGLDDSLQQLTMALLDLHWNCRSRVCRDQGITDHPGPRILEAIRQEVGVLPSRYVPATAEVDPQVCIGILWRETNECAAWWHGFNTSA